MRLYTNNTNITEWSDILKHCTKIKNMHNLGEKTKQTSVKDQFLLNTTLTIH